MFSPIAWARHIEGFKNGMILGTIMIVVVLIVIMGFCIEINASKVEDGPEDGFEPINKNYWSMIGFSFFMYEGIGGVMPLMAMTKDRSSFGTVLVGAMITLTITYISFADFCYYTFGDKLDETIIMGMMPSDNVIIQVSKLLFIVNIFFSYPICIYMTNIILEGYICKSCKKRGPMRKWLKNFSRSLVLAAAIIIALYFIDTLTNILALCGTILGTSVVMTVPTLCHYKLCAETTMDKV